MLWSLPQIGYGHRATVPPFLFQWRVGLTDWWRLGLTAAPSASTRRLTSPAAVVLAEEASEAVAATMKAKVAPAVADTAEATAEVATVCPCTLACVYMLNNIPSWRR